MADTATDLLNELKDSLHIPLGVNDDDQLLVNADVKMSFFAD